MDIFQVGFTGALFVIGFVCWLMLRNLKGNRGVSPDDYIFLCVAGIISYLVQVACIYHTDMSEWWNLTLISVPILIWVGIITMLAWLAFTLVWALSMPNQLSDSVLNRVAFSAVTLVGQVTYPLFWFGIVIGQVSSTQ